MVRSPGARREAERPERLLVPEQILIRLQHAGGVRRLDLPNQIALPALNSGPAAVRNLVDCGLPANQSRIGWTASGSSPGRGKT